MLIRFAERYVRVRIIWGKYELFSNELETQKNPKKAENAAKL